MNHYRCNENIILIIVRVSLFCICCCRVIVYSQSEVALHFVLHSSYMSEVDSYQEE